MHTGVAPHSTCVTTSCVTFLDKVIAVYRGLASPWIWCSYLEEKEKPCGNNCPDVLTLTTVCVLVVLRGRNF